MSAAVYDFVSLGSEPGYRGQSAVRSHRIHLVATHPASARVRVPKRVEGGPDAMRLLVLADLHYALPQYDWVMEVAGRFDIVIIAGDHLDTSSLVDLGAQSVVVQKYIGRLREKARLLICSGNHDLDSKNEAAKRSPAGSSIRADRASARTAIRLAIGDTLFTICPWWDGRRARGDRPAARGRRAGASGALIWVHHVPPRTTPISWDGQPLLRRHRAGAVDRRAQAGFRLLRPRPSGALRPRWVVDRPCRHAPGCSTPAGNTARRRLTSSSIPSGVMALWFSAAGNQVVHLDQPLSGRYRSSTELPDWLV